MYDYERSYKTGRALTSWLEFVGWVIVVLGVVVALAGFASAGLVGMASSSLGSNNTPFIVRIIAMVPGVLIAASGLMSIMLAQHTKATIDTSEMTRELLAIAKGQSNPEQTIKPAPPVVAPSQKDVVQNEFGDLVKVFKGREILSHAEGVSVDGVVFTTVIEAERHIKKQDQSA